MLLYITEMLEANKLGALQRRDTKRRSSGGSTRPLFSSQLLLFLHPPTRLLHRPIDLTDYPGLELRDRLNSRDKQARQSLIERIGSIANRGVLRYAGYEVSLESLLV